MKKMKNRFSILLVFAACLTMFLGTAVPASAEVDESTKEMLSATVDSFLGQVYDLDEDQLKQLEDQGGFYEVFYESWEEEKDIVGDFEKVESTTVDDSGDDQIVTTSLVKFKNYDAEVQMYFDEDGTTPTNYTMTVQYSLGEKVGQAAENMAVGLITVFVVLAILIIIMLIEGKIFTSIDKDKRKKAQSDEQAAAAPAGKPAAAVKSSAPAAAAKSASSDTEIAAVIAAAIAAAMEDNPDATGYRVRSIRKIGTRRWKRV